MKKILLFIILTFFYNSASFAAGQGESYAGIQYTIFNVDFDGIGDVDPTALVGKLGYFFNDNIAIEGRLGTSLQDDDLLGVDVDIESLFGIYGVFHASSDIENSFYGVLGYTDAEAEFSGSGGSVEGDDSSFSFGFGANFSGFNIEYMSYIEEGDTEATAISIGYMIRL